jgi:hypothetical protein
MIYTEFFALPWKTFKCKNLIDLCGDRDGLVAEIYHVVRLLDSTDRQVGLACTLPDLSTIMKIDPALIGSIAPNETFHVDLDTDTEQVVY